MLYRRYITFFLLLCSILAHGKIITAKSDKSAAYHQKLQFKADYFKKNHNTFHKSKVSEFPFKKYKSRGTQVSPPLLHNNLSLHRDFIYYEIFSPGATYCHAHFFSRFLRGPPATSI
jgi:hypothetical protein